MVQHREVEMVRSRGRAVGGVRRRVRSSAWRAHAILLLATGACLLSAPGALAANRSLTWAGVASGDEAGWGVKGNWTTNSVPTEKEALGTLTFPRLTGSCITEPANYTCYESDNEVTELSAESLNIDDGDSYEIWGDELALGGGGLSASPANGSSGPALDVLEMPLKLSATQTWSLSGRGNGELSGLVMEEAPVMSATTTKLTVQMGEQAALRLADDIEVGPVSIEGTNNAKAGSENGSVTMEDGELDSTDEQPVELSHISLSGSGEMGRLTTKDAELTVGAGAKPAGSIEATSATLDAGSEIHFGIDGGEAVAQSDYSQLTAEGAVDLAGAKLAVDVGTPGANQPCPTLQAGQVYTFISTPGTLSGAFANAPEHGADIPITFTDGCVATTQRLRITYNETGEPQTVSATVEAPPEVSEQPAAVALVEGESSTFHAAATGATSVQWQLKRGAGSFETDTADTGNTSDTLTVEHASVADSGDEYRALFKNAAGEVASSPATLTVSAKPVVQTPRTSAAPAGSGGVLSSKEGSPDAAIASTSVTVSSAGKLVLTVGCPAAVKSCRGTITLRTLTAVSALAGGNAARTRAAVLTLASGSFSVTGGASQKLTLTLSARGRALLARSHALRARASILARDPEGGMHSAQTILTLRPVKARHGR